MNKEEKRKIKSEAKRKVGNTDRRRGKRGKEKVKKMENEGRVMKKGKKRRKR